MSAPEQNRLLAGRYRLTGPLGQGGMGVVWRSRDELLDRDVAVKEVLLPAELSDEERRVLRERTLREARSAARLSHPHAVTIFDVVEEDGRPWIVMEFVASRSLAEVVREDGPLPPGQVALIGHQVLAALTTAHAAGVLHRDVKPGNVLLSTDGRAVLTDFGIATLEGDPSLTTSGMVLGSPAYLAPERVQAHSTGPESDLWSLGATMYTAVEGRPPYDRGAALATLAAVVTDRPDQPRLAGPLWPVIEGLLRKEPQDRISPAEADRMLRDIAATGEDRARPTPFVPSELPDAAGGERTSVLPAYSPPAGPTPSTEPSEPTGSTESLGSTGSRRSKLLAIGIALLVLTGLGWAGQRWADDPSAGPRSTPSTTGSTAASPTTQPSASASTRAPSPTPTPSSRTPSARPSTATPTSSGASVPAGFERYRDTTGFSLAVPAGWTVTRQNGRVYFRDPEGSRLLIIDQTDDPQPDPVADWTRQEQARRDSYAAYRRIGIAPVDYFQKAADWEFTYAGRTARTHVRIRGTVTGSDQAYGIYWSTPDSTWQQNLPYWQTFTTSFRPAG